MGVLASSLDHAHQIQLAFHLVAGLVTKSFWKPMAFPLHLEKVIDMLRDSDCLSPDDASDGGCMAATLDLQDPTCEVRVSKKTLAVAER